VPYPKGLEGHSDGDALIHAIVDAALGAMGEGDIGDYFSDRDEQFKGANSLLFINKVVALLKKKKLKISSIDAVVIAEAPKLSAYKDAMKKVIAKAFAVPVSRVGIKAKTNEGFGDIGKKKAIACYAVVSLKG
jgi:2-C-methyl-D-erythritol 2,4-cyclodiphosphate synthase